mgnify:CR=1 FL=1
MKKTVTIIMLLIFIAGAIFFILLNSSDNSTLGTNNLGYVTKDIYNHYGSTGPKIAVITGMHPREDLSTVVVPEVIKLYALTHNVEIINYKVTVTDNPEVFSTSRLNGESLVAQYVIPDIKKSDYSLVIICHDHERGMVKDITLQHQVWTQNQLYLLREYIIFYLTLIIIREIQVKKLKAVQLKELIIQ